MSVVQERGHAPLHRRRLLTPTRGGFVISTTAQASVVALTALTGAMVASGMSADVLTAMAGVVVLVAVAYRPEVGALLFVCAATAVPHHALFDRGLPALGGAIKVTDMLLLATLASWLAHAAVLRGTVRMPSRATTFLVVLGIALAILSIATANGHGTPTHLSLFELRPLLSFLLIFPVVSGVRSLRELEVGLGVFLAAASVAGLVLLWRYVHGEGDVASYTNGQLRIIDTALLLSPLLAAIWVAVLAPTVTRLPLLALLGVVALISLGALFFTFQRTGWLAFFVAFVLLLVRLSPQLRHRLLRRALPVALVALIAIIAVNARSTGSSHDPLRAGITRLTSITKFHSDVSGRYRIAEWKAAGTAIKRHPLTGIGLGSTISFWSPMYSKATNSNGETWTTSYIHNSYIWFALKLGLPGALVFVGLIALQVIRAGSSLRRTGDIHRKRLLLGALTTLIALLVLSLAGPHLNGDSATPYIALAIALVELAPLVGGRKTSDSPTNYASPEVMSA